MQIEAERGGGRLGEQLLKLHRELAREHVARRRRRATHRRDQRDELRLQLREQRRHPVRRHPRLVIVEQCVVARALVADRVRALARQREDPVEPGRERGVVVALARLDPHLLRHRRHARPLLDQPPRHPALLVERAADLAHVHRLRALRVAHERRALHRTQQLLVARVRLAVVHQPREQRALLRPVLHRIARHADFFIPLQQLEARRQQRLLARQPDHLLVGVLRIHVQSGTRRWWRAGAEPIE